MKKILTVKEWIKYRNVLSGLKKRREEVKEKWEQSGLLKGLTGLSPIQLFETPAAQRID